jgi:hypothetical protein
MTQQEISLKNTTAEIETDGFEDAALRKKSQV